MSDFDLFMIVTPDFVPGALVTLSSFLKHHPEEQRNVYLLHRDLGPRERQCLETLPFKYHYMEHDPRIVERAANLPIFPERRNRLLILQSFLVGGERPLLVLDADLLIQGSVEALMDHDAPLYGSGETVHLRGGWRDEKTLAPKEGEAPEGALTRTINTGVFRLGAELRTEKHYQDLLERLDPVWWNQLETDLTDQALLNHHFRDQIGLAPAEYNYVLRFRDIFEKASGCTPEECPILHFAGPLKPWDLHQVTSNDGDFVEASLRWTQEWLEVLKKI